MDGTNSGYMDVAVVGGGPAGISACLELSRRSNLKIGLFEYEDTLGGIPRSAHVFFGMRDQKRLYTGAAYARRLDGLIRKTAVDIHTCTTVLEVVPGTAGELHRIRTVSPEGLKTYACRFLLLATGCCESSREKRYIPGTRPAGIFTTGSLQKMVNLQHLKPGTRAVIVGSEHVAFSAAMTLRHAGVDIAAMIEPDSAVQTYPVVSQVLSRYLGFPVYTGTSVKAVAGAKRVEGIEWVRNGAVSSMACDTLVVTGQFLPDSALVLGTAIEAEPLTAAPVVDMSLETSQRNIFAAGNILRGADMHDLCALEARRAAGSILKRHRFPDHPQEDVISLKAQAPIRYVVPQRLTLDQAGKWNTSWFSAGVSIQVARTMKRATIEARCGAERIWRHTFSRLIANSRIPIPVEDFDWKRVDPRLGVTLTCTVRDGQA